MTKRNAAAHILGQPNGYYQFKYNDNLSKNLNIFVGNWIIPTVQKEEIE